MHPNVHSSIIYNSQDMETTQLPMQIVGLKRYGIYIYVCIHTHTHIMEYYSAIKEMKYCHLQYSQMDTENITLSEVNQTEKDKYYISLICRIKKIIQMNLYKKQKQGLPWWRSGWESACQCRGHGFEPWSGRIPHAAEQLGPCATATEPACHKY